MNVELSRDPWRVLLLEMQIRVCNRFRATHLVTLHRDCKPHSLSSINLTPLYLYNISYDKKKTITFWLPPVLKKGQSLQIIKLEIRKICITKLDYDVTMLQFNLADPRCICELLQHKQEFRLKVNISKCNKLLQGY